MTNYFEIWDKRLAAIETNQREILSRLSSTNIPSTEEIGGMSLFCEVTGLSEARGYALVGQRKVPHSKRGNRLYFKRSELIKWIADGNRQIEQPA